MTIQHSGQLLARIQRAHFNTIVAAAAGPAMAMPLPGVHLSPLFLSSQQGVHAQALNQSLAPDWVVATPMQHSDQHPWDSAHDHAQGKAPGSAALTAMGQVYIEPDILHPDFSDQATAATEGLDKDYPPANGTVFSPGWYQQEKYNNFENAHALAKGQGIRIAHPDTGFWRDHLSTPVNIREDQGWNFYEKNPNTIDPGITGILKNPGHGTATLALLAGSDKLELNFNGQIFKGFIGGAPEAEVVPIRIGASVVHIYTQALAQGLDYALAPRNSKPCDVVSLSHGGLPSSAWAAAVNRLYEAGVVVAAASGDSIYLVIADVATRFTVYPSAFNRVITVTGVTYDGKPYKTTTPGKLQGCWGPDAVMYKAVGGFTPNVPWMKRGTTDGWDMNGSGTSASTPQVAAACALWLQLYKDKFQPGWQRVEACRLALLSSVKNPAGGRDFSEIGEGVLDASAMLDDKLVDKIAAQMAAGGIKQSPVDEVSWSFWRELFGIAPANSAQEQMYETEAAQVLARTDNVDLIGAQANYHAGKPPQGAAIKTLRDAMIAEPTISNTLSSYLKTLP